MKNMLNEYRTIAVISASIIFLFYTSFQSYVGENVFLEILLGTTSFLFLFEILLIIYKKIIWRIVNQRDLLTGEWEYFYDSYGNDSTEIDKIDGNGIAQFEHGMGVLSVTGASSAKTESEAAEAKTLWNSTSYYFKESKLTIGMEFSNEIGTGLGFFILHIRKPFKSPFSKPKKMVGHFMYLLDKSEIRRGRVIFRRKENIVPNNS